MACVPGKKRLEIHVIEVMAEQKQRHELSQQQEERKQQGQRQHEKSKKARKRKGSNEYHRVL